jgi:hypothetical protein
MMREVPYFKTFIKLYMLKKVIVWLDIPKFNITISVFEMMVPLPCNWSFYACHLIRSQRTVYSFGVKTMIANVCCPMGSPNLAQKPREEWIINHLRYIRIHWILERVVWRGHHQTCSWHLWTVDGVLELCSINLVGIVHQYPFVSDTKILASESGDKSWISIINGSYLPCVHY